MWQPASFHDHQDLTGRAHLLRSFWLNQPMFAGQSLAVARVFTGFGVEEEVHGGGAHAYLWNAHPLLPAKIYHPGIKQY